MEVKTKKAEQAARTRRALMRAATKLFAARGYEDTYIDEVARRAEVTKGALYHQFRDKRELFEAVVRERALDLAGRVKTVSGEEMERRGVARNSWSRAVAGVQILLDRLCEPANRRILLLDGPVVLGRARWEDVWGARMLKMVHSIIRHAEGRGEVAPELVEPLSHMLFGALQETALAIGQASDTEAARRRFGRAAVWLLESVFSSRPSPSLKTAGAADSEGR